MSEVQVTTYIREQVVVSGYNMRTEKVALEGARTDSRWVCFRGWCKYTLFNHDPALVGYIRMLARYAFFAGIGYKTTMGFGQVAPDLDP